MRHYLIALIAAVSLWSGAAQAVPIVYNATLTGEAENPDVTTPGTGSATVIYDPTAHTLSLDVVFAGLVGNTTASHIHCCTPSPLLNAGVATQVPSFSGFPLGVTSGSYSNTFDLTVQDSFNLVYWAANGATAASVEAALATGLANGQAYLNIHTTFAPAGEIRGTLLAVPEPASLSLLGLGFGMLLARRRRTSFAQ